MIQSIFQKIRTPESSPNWSVILASVFVGAYIVIWIAAQALAVTLTNGDLAAPGSGAQALGALIASLLLAVVVVQWVRRRLPKTWQNALHLETSHTLPLFVCVLIGLGAAWAIDLFGVLFKLKGGQIVPPPLGALSSLSGSGSITAAWVIAAITALITLPLGEELLLRGLFYPALAGRIGNMGAILLTSAVGVILALLLAGPLPWYALIQPLLMGLVITTLRAHTKSTQMAIVARSMFGLFFVLTALISTGFGT